MQECILKVEGCEPIFMDGICCPVKYICGELAAARWFCRWYWLWPCCRGWICPTWPARWWWCWWRVYWHDSSASQASTVRLHQQRSVLCQWSGYCDRGPVRALLLSQRRRGVCDTRVYGASRGQDWQLPGPPTSTRPVLPCWVQMQ